MMSLTFGLFTQVSDSGSQCPLVYLCRFCCNSVSKPCGQLSFHAVSVLPCKYLVTGNFCFVKILQGSKSVSDYLGCAMLIVHLNLGMKGWVKCIEGGI